MVSIADIRSLAHSLQVHTEDGVDAQAEAMRAIAVALRGGRGVTMRRDRFAMLFAPYVIAVLPTFVQEHGDGAAYAALFDAMNTDGSGVLSIAELMCGAAALFDFDRRELSHQLFGVCDATANGGRGDGRLTWRECVAAFAAFGAVAAIVRRRVGVSPVEKARAEATAMFAGVLGEDYGEHDCITKAQWCAWRLGAYSQLRAGQDAGGARRATLHEGETALSPPQTPQEHSQGRGGARRATFHEGEMALSPPQTPQEQRAVAMVSTPTDDAVSANRNHMMGWDRRSPLWPPLVAPAMQRHSPPPSSKRREQRSARPPSAVPAKSTFVISTPVPPISARAHSAVSTKFTISPPPGMRVGNGPPNGPAAAQLAPPNSIGTLWADITSGSAASDDVALLRLPRRDRQMATWHAAFVEAVGALRDAGADADDFFRSAEQQRTTAKGLSRRLLARGVRLRPTVLHNLYLYTIAAVKGAHRTSIITTST